MEQCQLYNVAKIYMHMFIQTLFLEKGTALTEAFEQYWTGHLVMNLSEYITSVKKLIISSQHKDGGNSTAECNIQVSHPFDE